MKYSAEQMARLGIMLNELTERDVDGLLDAYHRKEDIATAARQVSDMALSIAMVAEKQALDYHNEERKGDRYVSVSTK